MPNADNNVRMSLTLTTPSALMSAGEAEVEPKSDSVARMSETLIVPS